MNEIYIGSAALPVICGCGGLTANEPFLHADRTVDFNVMIYVTSGCIYVTEEQTDYELKAGDLLFLKSGLRHFGKKPCPRGTSWHYAHFILNGQESLPRYGFEPPPQYEPLIYSAPLPKYIKLSESSDTACAIKALTSHFERGGRMCAWRLNAELHELLTGLCFSKETERPRTTAELAGEYLRAHCRENFSAADIEKALHLSYKRLAVVFKEEKAVTMQQYHNRCRMEEAARLLRGTLLTVGEIAAELGFEDALYFSRRFRAFFALSPTAYRQKSLNPPITVNKTDFPQSGF